MSRTNFDKFVIQYDTFENYKNSKIYSYTYSNLQYHNYPQINDRLCVYYLEQIGILNEVSSNLQISESNINIPLINITEETVKKIDKVVKEKKIKLLQ